MGETIEGEVFDAKLAGKIICLVVEDTKVGVQRIRQIFDGRFHLIVVGYLEDAENTLRTLAAQKLLDVVVTNLTIKRDLDGFQVFKMVKEVAQDVLIVVWTKHSDSEIQRALQAGADFGVRKYTDDEASMAEAIIAVLKQRKEEEI